MTDDPNEAETPRSLPSARQIDEALGKVANGQVPERRVVQRRQSTDRRLSIDELKSDQQGEAEPGR